MLPKMYSANTVYSSGYVETSVRLCF